MSNDITGGVRRPIMYFVVAIIAVMVALPLAVATGQMRMGGVFDECYSNCTGETMVATAPN